MLLLLDRRICSFGVSIKKVVTTTLVLSYVFWQIKRLVPVKTVPSGIQDCVSNYSHPFLDIDKFHEKIFNCAAP